MRLFLKELRKLSGMTQKDLADVLQVDLKTVGNWERGRSSISLEDAVKVAEAIDCTVNDLCGWYLFHPEERPAYADGLQAELNAYYERMNEQGRATLVDTARMMSASVEARVVKDGGERVDDSGVGVA